MIITKTPIHEMDNLGKDIGVKNLYIKRDDLNDFYGNKTRHIKAILDNLKGNNVDTIVLKGSGKSNCMRIYGMAAKRMGFNVQYNFTGKIETGNGKIMELINQRKGDRGRYVEINYDGDKEKAAKGFIDASEEMIEQLPNVTRIYLYSYDASWIGLTIGNLTNGLRAKIVAVRNVGAPHGKMNSNMDVCYLNNLFDIVGVENIPGYIHFNHKNNNSDKQHLKKSNKIRKLKNEIVDKREVAGKFGNIVKKVLNSEGILLDPIYTGRAMAELIKDANNGMITDKDVVLFWHTGGVFLNV